jgi:hypothetical protein
MRALRVLLGAAGTGLMAYGGWLVLRQVQWTVPYLRSWLTWLALGPVLHDVVVAPAVMLIGLLAARLLRPPWRGAALAGLATTGVLLLIAVPLLWRPTAAPPNPGSQDRAYLPGLAVFLGVLWAALLAGAALRVRGARPGGAARGAAPAHGAHDGGAVAG